MEEKKSPALILPVDYWENEFREGWKNGNHPNCHFLNFLEKYHGRLGPNFLDVGSGDGRHLLPLAKIGYQVTGLELTKSGIESTREKLNGLSSRVSLIQGSFHELPFANQSFDSAISVQALHYNNWPGACQAFAEIARVLKTNGLFFFRARSERGHWRQTDKKIADKGITRIEKRSGGFTVMVHDYTLSELENLAGLNSLELLSAIDEDYPGIPGQWNAIFKKT